MQFTYSPNPPSLFPSPILLPIGFPIAKANLLIIAHECGWDPTSAGFYHTETEDEIRKWWEQSKVELTREPGKPGGGGGGDGNIHSCEPMINNVDLQDEG
jgi:hypothetical protein